MGFSTMHKIKQAIHLFGQDMLTLAEFFDELDRLLSDSEKPCEGCGCPLKDLMWCCEQGETCVDDCRPGTRQWSRDHGWIIGPKEGDNRVEGER